MEGFLDRVRHFIVKTKVMMGLDDVKVTFA
jgi:hypothetical protein